MVAIVPINEFIKSCPTNGITKTYPPIQVSVTNKKRQRVNTKDVAAVTIAQSPPNISLHSLIYLKVYKSSFISVSRLVSHSRLFLLWWRFASCFPRFSETYKISPLIFYKDVSALFMLSELQPCVISIRLKFAQRKQSRYVFIKN
jgi:hypothetical protein